VRVLFFGYSQVGFRAVELLLRQGHEVVAVVTHRDDPHEHRWYHVPAEAAAKHGLACVYGDEIEGEVGRYAREMEPDLLLSVFYRKMLPRQALEAPRIAALNLHPSLLPAYRGRAPINWVLVRGEVETGVTLHHMVGRADAGDIVAQRRIAIDPRETALSLYYKVEQESTALLEEALPLVAAGNAPRIRQDESRASKFGGRRPEDGRIDWSWPAARVDCLVRAVAPPWPGAFGEVALRETGETRAIAIREGEPAGECAGVAPGAARREGGKLFVACADRWFRVDEEQQR
jgi:methionyl-tRNA formyltransferase